MTMTYGEFDINCESEDILLIKKSMYIISYS